MDSWEIVSSDRSLPASMDEDNSNSDLPESEATEMSAYEEATEVIKYENKFWNSEHDAGAICYAIAIDWWNKWCEHTGFKLEGKSPIVKESEAGKQPSPEAIDNGTIRQIHSYKEGQDYTCKSPKTWELFCQLYPGSGPAVELPVTPDGRVAEPKVYFVHRSSDLQATPLKVCLHAQSKLSDVKSIACKAFQLDESEVQTWDYFNRKKHFTEPLDEDLDRTVSKANLLDKQDVLIQEKVDGKFVVEEREATSSSDTILPSTYHFSRYISQPTVDTVTQREGAVPGTAGLSNLGNTCFMNSSLQCLAHAVPLVRTFLSDAYKADINRDNPLGNQGKLAEAFGEVMKKLWQEDTGVVTPKHFKQQLASFHPHFAGYNQHDSQELLAFLLDGLHEDLNRVKQKPYIEIPDSNGRPDEELAEEAWQIWKARNDSCIADHFQGMYKSTLVCPECNYSSVTMETFNCLSLPLPSAKMRDIEVTVVSMDGSAPPTHYTVQVLKLGIMKDLYISIAALVGIEKAQADKLLLLVDTFDGRVRTKFTDLKEPLADAVRGNMSLLAYKYSSADLGPSSGGKEMHVFQRRKRKRRAYSFFASSPEKELFAAPLLLWLPESKLTEEENGDLAPMDSLLDPNGPVSIAVEAALRPFKRKKQRSESKEEANKEEAEPDEMRFTLPGVEPVASGDVHGPEPEVTNLENESDEAQAGNVLYNVGTPPATPEFSPLTSPLGTPRANSFTSDTSQTKPFDMFALQQPSGLSKLSSFEQTEPEAAVLEDSHMAPDPSQPAYKIRATDFRGTTPRSQAKLDNNELYFAIDWDPSAVQEYDPECMEEPQIHSSTEEARARNREGPRPCTLQECLEAFLEGERLEDSESWCCKQCKKLVQAHKKLDLWDLPEVAVIHLKRFSYSSRFRDKIDSLVDFPLNGLNLQPATLKAQESEPLYELFAVSNHFGGLGGGHYTAFAKLNDSGQWYCFDDSYTRRIQPEDVVTSNAYVLFYRRKQETDQDRGKSSAELKEGPKTESEWSDVAENEDGSEKWTEVNATVTLPQITTAIEGASETDSDYPMQSLPGSPPGGDYDLSPTGAKLRKNVQPQNAPENGLLSEEDAMAYSTMY